MTHVRPSHLIHINRNGGSTMPIEPIDPIESPEQYAFDDELGTALRRTADTFRPDDSRGLVAGGHAYGRRLRRRRNLSITAGVAAFAVLGVGGALVGGLAKNNGSSGVAAGPQKLSATTVAATLAPSAKPRPSMTARQVTNLFVSMLPKGHITKLPGRGTDDGPLAQVIFDDGKGPGLVEVGVGYEQAPDPCPAVDLPGTSCTSSRVNGGMLTIYKGFEYPDHRVETKDWIATYVTRSGAVVDLSEWNSPQEKDAPITRQNPPLNSATLAKIVTDPRWQRVIDALPPRPTAFSKGTPLPNSKDSKDASGV
jgi:hypothetical protein